MPRFLSPLLALLTVAVPGVLLAADPAPVADPAAATEPSPIIGSPLPADDLGSAAKTDSVSIPTPGELLAAVEKVGKPDWSSTYRAPIPTTYSSRAQMALNIGGLIADGYIAVEAEDAQQVKNIGRDIIALAKPLGVQEGILNRGKSLTDFAQNNQWDALKEELEATQNEVKESMADNKDEGLINLVSLGGWIRGINAMSGYLSKHYSPDGARLLRQPAVARLLNEKLGAMPGKIKDDKSVKKAREALGQIEHSVNFPPETVPTAQAVGDLTALTTDLLKELAKK